METSSELRPTRDATEPVTFCLLAFNQEAFVEAAVRAALSQDYPNLELIISDDCSADRTFDIAREAVEGYLGPHRVIVRKTTRNLGSLAHVADVAKIAVGKLIVLAAGDDISKPERTRVLVSAWQATGAWGLCSRFDRIDASGTLLQTSVASGVLDGRGFRDFFYEDEGPVRIVHGCSSAYDARAFDFLNLTPDDFILSEDGAMSVLLNLLGKTIVNLDDSLVLYRESPNSLTNSRTRNRLSFARIIEDEKRIEWFAQAQANRCRLFLRMNDDLGTAQVRRMKVEPVAAELKRQTMRARWWNMPIGERVTFVLKDRRSTWAWPRMFGLSMFFMIKWLSRRLSGSAS